MTMCRILFVDDDRNVLSGLQRLLRGMRNEWDMQFVESGAAALAAMAAQPFDVIVSDMRMPGMDGAELLSEVRRRHPGVLRIILSGYSEAESVMRTVGPAHQFLAKPCSDKTLVDVVRRALELQRMVDSAPLRALLAGIRNLPTPSDTYYALMKYIELPQASANGVAEIIGRDMAMTAELLKLTNSAYFTMPSRVTTPLQAVRILGFETLRALVLRIGIFRSFKGLEALGRLMDDLNHDSFRVARIAERIARIEGLDERRIEEAFCAGMLSPIGMLVLLDRLPAKFSRAKGAVATGEDPLDAELAAFGASHLQVGAYLLGVWGFNQAVVEAVAFSGRPGILQGDQFGVPAAVHVARVLAGPSPVYACADAEREVGRMALDFSYLESLGKGDRLATWTAETMGEWKN